MAITAGSDAVASDFITTSAGAGDVGKVPELDAAGQLDNTFIKNPNRKQEIIIDLVAESVGVSTTSGSYVGAGNQAFYYFTAANWDTGMTWYFEVFGGDGSANPSRCQIQLHNDTDTAEITNLVVGQVAGTYLRSSALTMPSSSTKKLSARFRNNTSGSTVTVFLARLIGVMPA